MGHTASHYRTCAQKHKIASAQSKDEQARMTHLELAEIFRARADLIDLCLSQQSAFANDLFS